MTPVLQLRKCNSPLSVMCQSNKTQQPIKRCTCKSLFLPAVSLMPKSRCLSAPLKRAVVFYLHTQIPQRITTETEITGGKYPAATVFLQYGITDDLTEECYNLDTLPVFFSTLHRITACRV